MNVRGVVCGSATALVLAACASAGGPAVEPSPYADLPSGMPVSWFAERFAPYDTTLTERHANRSGGQVLVIVDGRQIDAERPENRPILNEALTPVEERRDRMFIFKRPCEKDHFGRAGMHGVILIFTPEWDGPEPRMPTEWAAPCEDRVGG